MIPRVKVLILGAGVTGLGAAWRLAETGESDWQILEADDHVGGLSASFRDEKGFFWDVGGHVLFSHYPAFDAALEKFLSDAWVKHRRRAWVFMDGRFIPYPLQQHVEDLPEPQRGRCIEGLRRARQCEPAGGKIENFAEYLLANFGEGLCEAFLFPYNRKCWACEPSELSADWVGERVAPPVESGRRVAAWGPNAEFRFPLSGGTGAIWNACAAKLDASRIRLRTRATRIDASSRTVFCADGTSVHYEWLVSTIPLNELVRLAGEPHDLACDAKALVHTSTHVAGLGFAGPPPESLAGKSWMYFPQADVPCYRVTVFSNYSPNNVPAGGAFWSLLCETSESPRRPLGDADLPRLTLESLVSCGLLDREVEKRLCSTWRYRSEYGYPVPAIPRDAILSKVQPRLEAMNILSRGRFGGWKYEVGNMDHSFMQGVEAADRICTGRSETTYIHRVG